MESVAETPVKRRKTENGHVPSQSQSDDFQTQETVLLDHPPQNVCPDFETVPTLPVACKGPKTPPRLSDDEDFATLPFSVKETPVHRPTSPFQSSYITQPTQVAVERKRRRSNSTALEDGTESQCLPSNSKPEVQVAASSPAPQPQRSTGILANMIAPAGTAFRAPYQPRRVANPTPERPPQTVIDITSDDEVRFAGGSSDDEKYNRDLKPTLVKSSSTASAGAKSTQSSFSGGLDQYRHSNGPPGASNGPSREAIMKRAADPMALAYGNASKPVRPLQKTKKQTGPAKAAPIEDMDENDIMDYSLRQKVIQIGSILPGASVSSRHAALLKTKENFNDALQLLTDRNGMSEDELVQDAPRKSSTKVQVKDKKTIFERQQERLAARNQESQPSKSQSHVDLTQDDDANVNPKPRRRLMRRADVARLSPPSSPAPGAKVSAPATKSRVRSSTPSDLDSDSDAEEQGEHDPLREGSLLKYFNSCKVADLVDMASTTKVNAELLLSKRPFKTMEQVRSIVQEGTTKAGAKRKSKAQPVGARIVEICEDMWTGYNAVDQLVQNCEELGRPLVEEMRKWGVSAFGNANNGELELVQFGDSESPKDSGIATPKSMSASDEDSGVKTMAQRKNHGRYFQQPESLAEGVVLKDYQVVGINWLSLLFRKGLSCILADDMGLGKTCQVISFIAHLRETGIQGPHVIVVPSSVLENWLREFERFCPDITVTAYHGSKDDRPYMAAEIMENPPDVLVTTYAIAKKTDDRRFLNRIRPTCCIYDEGHMLKNPTSEQYKELMKIGCKFRLLLTGTPLQNNLSELIALLGFLMPDLFKNHQEELQAIFKQKVTTDDEQQQSLLSANRIARAKSMMTPFILRRKKHQVLKDIPAKHRRVDYCEMTPSQNEKYYEVVEDYRDMIRRRQNGGKITAKDTSNILMRLRKAALHPLLFRRLYTDDLLRKMSKACKKEPEFSASNEDLIYEDLEWASDMELHRWCLKHPSVRKFSLKDQPWLDSGKVRALVELLQKYRDNGDRVLIFSQFVMMLDVLEEVLETISMKFARLDGSVDINERQQLIDRFYKEENITVFMLSTKAGGAGVNLACANKVIIFDGSFNPQDDVQAENRAHRVGQTREVEVVRLLTKTTVEEQIYSLGQTKLALDERVAGDAEDEKKTEKRVEKLLEETLVSNQK